MITCLNIPVRDIHRTYKQHNSTKYLKANITVNTKNTMCFRFYEIFDFGNDCN